MIPGAQGRILAALAQVSVELSLRNLARLAGVSPAQASRVLARLLELGVVRRRDVPPVALFQLEERHVASRAVLMLARAHATALADLGAAAAAISPPPRSMVVFGSFARGDADPDSDLDVVAVRPADVSPDDESWTNCVQTWREQAEALTGNRVELIELDDVEARDAVASERSLWESVLREGVTIFGRPLTDRSMRRSMPRMR